MSSMNRLQMFANVLSTSGRSCFLSIRASLHLVPAIDVACSVKQRRASNGGTCAVAMHLATFVQPAPLIVRKKQSTLQHQQAQALSAALSRPQHAAKLSHTPIAKRPTSVVWQARLHVSAFVRGSTRYPPLQGIISLVRQGRVQQGPAHSHRL